MNLFCKERSFWPRSFGPVPTGQHSPSQMVPFCWPFSIYLNIYIKIYKTKGSTNKYKKFLLKIYIFNRQFKIYWNNVWSWSIAVDSCYPQIHCYLHLYYELLWIHWCFWHGVYLKVGVVWNRIPFPKAVSLFRFFVPSFLPCSRYHLLQILWSV